MLLQKWQKMKKSQISPIKLFVIFSHFFHRYDLKIVVLTKKISILVHFVTVYWKIDHKYFIIKFNISVSYCITVPLIASLDIRFMPIFGGSLQDPNCRRRPSLLFRDSEEEKSLSASSSSHRI